MKNYRQKECCRRDSRRANDRYTKSTLHIDFNTKNESPNKVKKDLFNGVDKQRKITSSFICTCAGHNQKELVRSSQNHDEALRPSSCTCPHGHYHDEEVRPASCPYGYKHDRKHSHGSSINTNLRPIPQNRSKSTSEHMCTRKHKFYSIHAPQEPLIQIPKTISSKENRNEVIRPWTTSKSQRKIIIPFSKSYKNVNMAPHGSRITWSDYHRLSVIHEFLDCLESANPTLCSAHVIGRSLEKRDIKLLKVSNSKADKCGVWMDSGIHAREWIGPAVNTYVANYIASHFKSLPTYITNKDWFFLPVANPDGYEYSHTTDRMWRKNKACVNGKCVGVDLNRNFSFGWGGQGSSDNPHNSFYRGSKPFSEPESCAIRDFISSGSKKFRLYVTLHSYGEVIIFPFADNDTLCPGYIRLLEGATVMSKAIHRTNGRVYKVGISKDMMYQASGTSNDWSHGVVGIPYCYLIELRSKKDRLEDYYNKNSKCRFKVPCEEIEETGNEILNSLFALLEFIDSYPEIKLVAENPGYAIPKSTTACKMAPLIDDLSNTQVWEVKLINDEQRKFIKTLDSSGVLNIWREDTHVMDIEVEADNALSVIRKLNGKEIPYTVVISDVHACIQVQQTQIVAADNRKMSWNQYHRLDIIYHFMDDLATEYPNICSVHEIGKSVEGRTIMMLKISNGHRDNVGVWIDGGIHAREWITPAVVTYLADQITKNYKNNLPYFTNKDWYFLPVINPDGYEFTHTTDRMWRKNRRITGKTVGVDLNRNFSYGWGKDEGSSDEPSNVFFRGSKPFSEPETLAIKNAIMTAANTFKVFLSFHSYGEVILFPWGHTDEVCPDYVSLLEGGTLMSKAIFETHGRTYKVGSTKDLMYYAAGTSIDWSYGELDIPFSYMVELRDKENRFLLPAHGILDTSEEIYNGLIELMKYVDLKSAVSSAVNCSVATVLDV
ncbi:uncharacterized protein LOC113231549 [Hyposmocoma kahamanoa]|uniref:uncharacterized protein LOC113231549 n=1 Tax=Hyposmocoma kahamanoa TaxID=1477025 RepID=UPI000E6D5D96|nr:uncharacterized protein LOC113231549 [Hyposmocoma kahamanoa]